MKRYTKMMLMNGGKDRDKEHDYRDLQRDPYVDSKFRDRRGREHYDNGRYAPARSDYDGYRGDGYPVYPTTVPPVYNRYNGSEYPVNKIGFAVEGEMERMPEMNHDYRENAEYNHMDEMEHRTSERQGGYAEHRGGMKMNKQMADQWMSSIENADGTTGAHWSMEQAKQVMAQRGIEADPIAFWVALNAEYSDRCKQYKKHGVNTIDMYVDGVMDFWMHDKDAVEDKLAAYYENIVKH